MARSRSRAFILALVMAHHMALPAWGRDTATDGVVLPFPTSAHLVSPLSLEANPAQIAFLNSWSVHFLGAFTENDQGQGQGLFAASPIFGPLYGGMAAQILQGTPLNDRGKISFAGAFRIIDDLSLALTYSFFVTSEESKEELNDLGAFDLGLAWHPISYLSLGFYVHNLESPLLQGDAVPRVYDIGLAMVPPGERVTLAADVRLDEELDEIRPSLGMTLEVIDGLVLEAWAGLPVRDDDVGLSLRLGLYLNLEQVGLGGGVLLHSPEADDLDYHGWFVNARVSGELHRSLVPKADYVEICLGGNVVERERGFSFLTGKGVPMYRITQSLNALVEDDDVKGILVRIDGLDIGMACAQEVRNILRRARQRGKEVIVHLNDGSLESYVIATAGTQVVSGPAVPLFLPGFKVAVTYYKDSLDMVGIRAEIIAIGRYKSAPEAYTRSTMSEAAREVAESLTDDLHDQLVTEVAKGRSLEREAVRAAIDEALFIPDVARRKGLVDRVAYADEVRNELEERGGVIPYEDYADPRRRDYGWPREAKIALVVVEGMIIEGKSIEYPFWSMVGSQTISQALRKARTDPTIDAVVLRIDSPGGSATASDAIWREVVLTRRAKPVVVSMGDTAASGGYYIAAGANKIFASPATITGSIGIFAGKADISGLTKLLRVNHVVVKEGEKADMFSLWRPFSDEERQRLHEELMYGYRSFVSRVAEGRGLKESNSDAWAQGRVWTGRQALRLGLVDSLGGLEDAIDEAKDLAGVKGRRTKLVVLPERDTMLTRVIKLLSGMGSISLDVSQVVPEALTERLSRLLPPMMLYRDREMLLLPPFEVELH